MFIEAVLWIARTGSPWRDLPAQFGNWSTAFRRFRDWREADVFRRIFDALSDEPDMEYAMVDAARFGIVTIIIRAPFIKLDLYVHIMNTANLQQRVALA